MTNSQFTRLVVFVSSLVPGVLIALDYFSGAVSDTPTVMRNTGICCLIFLSLSLAVTPLRRITGKNYWSLVRRMLGLYAFFYACLHVSVYVRSKGGDIPRIFDDILGNKFTYFGMSAFVLMVPLAATSTVWAIKKMGNKNWKRLHKLVYLAAICAAIHYLMYPKAIASPLSITFACILGGLLLFRIVAWARDKWFPAAKAARPVPERASVSP